MIVTKKLTRSWVVPFALLGLAGCSKPGADEVPAPAPASEDTQATAWVPGTPVPAQAHAEGTEHTMEMDWIRRDGSVDGLTDHSALIVSGQVESTRYDVVRAWAQSKVEGQPTGPESGIYSDLPVTIATVRIGDIARSSQELKTSLGGTVAQGSTVEIMFPGGLLADGCTMAPQDSSLPEVGAQAVFFLVPQGGTAPLAMNSTTGLYSVTGGPLGQFQVKDGLIQAAGAQRHAAATEGYAGKPVSALLERAASRAKAVQYMGPDLPKLAMVDESPSQGPSAQSWCGVPYFAHKWCRKPTNITFTDYTSATWPVGDGMNEWMYNSYNNSLYLHWRSSGTSDVMVYEANYGANNWYGYATYNAASASCMANAVIKLNTYYYSGWHYAKTVSTHEIGHVLGLNHHKDCNSIMYYQPVSCAANITTCDMQAVAERYPY